VTEGARRAGLRATVWRRFEVETSKFMSEHAMTRALQSVVCADAPVRVRVSAICGRRQNGKAYAWVTRRASGEDDRPRLIHPRVSSCEGSTEQTAANGEREPRRRRVRRSGLGPARVRQIRTRSQIFCPVPTLCSCLLLVLCTTLALPARGRTRILDRRLPHSLDSLLRVLPHFAAISRKYAHPHMSG
jgi:hypothetical protein